MSKRMMDSLNEPQGNKCDFCMVEGDTIGDLKTHYQICHKICLQQCKFCNAEFTFTSELERHLKKKHTDKENKRHECERCSSSFKSEKSLKYHVKTRHINKQEIHKCNECDVTFQYKSSYAKHMKLMHESLTYIKCNLCPKIFNQKQTLKRHREVEHSENFKRAQCKLCPASYKYKEYLHIHMKKKHFANARLDLCDPDTLTEERKHRCHVCSVNFKKRVYLLAHQKKYHNRKVDVFQCDKCPTAFTTRESYNFHMKKIHCVDKCDKKAEEDEFYINSDIDFEHVLMNDVEFKQLLIFKKRKCNQNKSIVIVDYETPESDEEIEIDDDEVDVIRRNMKEFFSVLISSSNKDIGLRSGGEKGNNKNTCVGGKDIEVLTQQDSDQITNLISDDDSANLSCSLTPIMKTNVMTVVSEENITKQSNSVPQNIKENVIDSGVPLITKTGTETVSAKLSSRISKQSINKTKKSTSPASDKCAQDSHVPENIKENVIDIGLPLIIENASTDVSVHKPSNRTMKQRLSKTKTSISPVGYKCAQDNNVPQNIKGTVIKDVSAKLSNMNSKQSLNKTKKSISPASYKCTTCNRDFKLKAHLARHSKRCKRNNASVKNVEIDLLDQRESSMFQCVECNILFPDEDLLKQHQLWEHEIYVTLHKCCQCALLFNQLGDLQHHMETKHSKVY